jgi:hypothetical protein
MFSNIPEELKAYRSWVVWRSETDEDGKPTKRPYSPLSGTLASPTDASTWASYEEAVTAFNSGWFSGIGFVLSEADPYTFIDLDDTNKLTELGLPKFADPQAEFQLQQQIYETFQSYAEISPSGKGLHIICKGYVPSGKRQGSVELYSKERYMTMTGNVYRNAPIVEADYERLLSLWQFLGGKEEQELTNVPNAAQTAEDSEIIQRAASAANGPKFIDLLNGNWQHMYQSQSEADFAFIDIIAFYTDNQEQVERIFNNSVLGARNKQTTIKGLPYVKHMTKRAFDRKLPQVDTTGLKEQIEAAIQAQQQEPKKRGRPRKHVEPQESPYTVPPGIVGRIARYIHDAAPRPVPEIALAGAVGLVAGMTGRAYNISGTGLNQYILLLARTGTGKEAIGAGISSLLSEVKKYVPTVNEFVGPTVIASPQALIKKLGKNRSFVSIIGEFGLKLQQMTGRNATAADRGVMTAMLDLFNKSGKGSVFGAMAYSDTDKNVDAIEAPALSILGESTEKSFFEAIDEHSVASGLVPRFTVIEYRGDRPDLNERRLSIADCPQLVDEVAKLAANCAMLNHQNQVVTVALDPEAESIFREYNQYVDNQIRGRDDVSREIWNRAHIKALKMAGLLAVGCNWINPVVNAELAHWAINVENANVAKLMHRFESGEVGSGLETSEVRQQREIKRVIKDWLTLDWTSLEKYKAGTVEMYNARVVPYKYIAIRLQSLAAFREDRRGATAALQRTLQSMSDHGDLQPTKNKTLYNSLALVYAPTNIGAFL